MNLIQLRISFANAWRSWNSFGKTFPCCERLPWVMPAGWHTRKDQLWSSRNKAVNPTSKQTTAASCSWRFNSKMDLTAAQKKDFSVPQVVVNIKLALSQAKVRNHGEFSLFTVPHCAILNSFGTKQVFDETPVHVAATSWRQSLSQVAKHPPPQLWILDFRIPKPCPITLHWCWELQQRPTVQSKSPVLAHSAKSAHAQFNTSNIHTPRWEWWFASHPIMSSSNSYCEWLAEALSWSP